MEDGEPMGGNSMAAVSSELRLRWARTMGVAAFVDGGMAYVDSRPDFEIPFLWGIGGGVRYYLGMTPLRVDVAFPLNKRNEIDADFQIYVSLGQSF
jgi:translocation and assembly module TamA